jgi:large subunit ribosomal protein L10
MAAIRGSPPKWKVQTVEELRKTFKSHPVVAIVSFRGVPSNQMQRIRRELRGKALIKVVKNTLIEKALEGLEDSYKKLEDFLYDQTALVFTDMNPFKLYKLLEETKEPSPLKPNQISPVDVVVEKGPTPIPPGPMMAELQNAGIPVAIERGKVVVRETVTVVKAGEVVKPEVARALNVLGVKPIKIGLDTRVIYDNGVLLTPDVLAIDVEKVKSEFAEAYQKALNLAVNCAYVTEETAEILIIKAVMDARNLAINAGLPVKDVMPEILAKAHMEALTLASLLPESALDDELRSLLSSRVVEEKEEVVEEKKEEEEKEEEKEEEEEESALEGLGALFG